MNLQISNQIFIIIRKQKKTLLNLARGPSLSGFDSFRVCYIQFHSSRLNIGLRYKLEVIEYTYPSNNKAITFETGLLDRDASEITIYTQAQICQITITHLKGSRQRHSLANMTTCSTNNCKVYVPFWVEGHYFLAQSHSRHTPSSPKFSYSISFHPFWLSQLCMQRSRDYLFI